MDRKRALKNPELLLTHADFVRRLARSLLFDADAAEDAVQGTWVAALETPPGTGVTRGWLGTVVRNFVRQGRRGETRRVHREKESARKEGIPSVSEVVQREAVRREVVDAVLELDETYRTAILLRYYEELPPREIAQRLDLPVETVRTRIKRGLDKLRHRLDEKHQGDRSAWGAVLLPFAGREALMATTSMAAGSLLTSTAAKVAAALLVVGGGATAWWVAQSGDDEASASGADTTASAGAQGEAGGTPGGEQGDGEAREAAGALAAPSSDVVLGADRKPVDVAADATLADAITGRVLVQDQTPIAGAVVLFTYKHPEEMDWNRERFWMEEGPHDFRAETDEEGRFVFRPKNAKRLWARVHTLAPGWLITTRGGKWTEPGNDYQFRGEGTPVGTLRVRAQEASSGEELKGFAVGFERDGGEYVRDVDTDSAVAERVLALSMDTRSAEFRVTIHDPRVTAETTLVRLDQGATEEITIAFEWGRELSGVVVDAAGNPVAGALVFFGGKEEIRRGRPTGVYAAEHVPHAAETDAGGAFTLRGSGQLLTAWAKGHTPATVSASEGARIALAEGATIRGRILRPDGTPYPDGRVTLDRDERNEGIPLNPDGTFEFTGVEAGTHGLSFPPERWVVVDVQPGATLEFEAPTLLDEVRLTLMAGNAPFDDGGAQGEGERGERRGIGGIVVGLGPVASLHEFGRREGIYRVGRIVPGRYAFIQRRGIIGFADIEGPEAILDVGDKSLLISAAPGTQVWIQPEGVNDNVAYWSRRQLLQSVPDSGELELSPLPAGRYEVGIAGGPVLETVNVTSVGTRVSLGR
ncbi:MAG: sigma-70 family RNA polymerase sigma factor [Planctomycetota bacterium]|nr:sigma-70 family RNA polymerase sigma factor [Planctomycetota bacterium]